MRPQQLYVVGFALALIGSLATAAAQVLAGTAAIGVLTLGGTVALAFGLRNVLARDGFALEPSLSYRVANWGGAAFVVAIGLLMVGIGIASLGAIA